MKALLIAKLRIKLILKSPRNIVSLFLFPLILIYLISYIYSPNTVSTVPIAVVDKDISGYSKILISLIKENDVISVLETNEENARELIRKNKIEGAYIIEHGFEELIKGDKYPKITVLKSGAAIGADTISEIIASGVVRLLSNARAANIVVSEYEWRGITYLSKDVLWQNVFDTSESYWYPEQLMKLKHRQINGAVEIGGDSLGNMGLGSGYIGIIITFLVLSLGYIFTTIVTEKREGTLIRLYLSLSEMEIILGYLLSMMFFLIVQILILHLIFSKVFNIFYGIPIYSFFIIMLLYSIYISSIVMTIAIRMNITESLNSYYSIVVILTSIVGGCFWPVELLSRPFQYIALFTPQGLFLYIIKLTRIGAYFEVIAYSLLIITISILLIRYSAKKLSIIIQGEI
ncbi:ABC transporter permease [Serpentinicella alkaliphila]|uniref:ABC-type Na+ efflux pump permease subunit n=1 Tax=Serpentinicella alkaliphila TaxID=1734049 RepID=A0A4R2TJY1_9FIRM|nr:ABC transporter permease [Serpentinicella alkaliphila]QUH26990.1 ABC transporter permease [Serpentinicella alkaliphila]TCQ01485.1 ABC-type Na+ efflux pump permease subunit [Serpentinicella alkaliphila]